MNWDCKGLVSYEIKNILDHRSFVGSREEMR